MNPLAGLPATWLDVRMLRVNPGPPMWTERPVALAAARTRVTVSRKSV
jgi:hypothetical protein